MIDFPANPTTGQSFQASNGATWIWDGAKWVSGGAGSPVYLPLSGGTMTGPIIAPSGYALVDANMARYKNRIINGDMSVDQRNGGASVAMTAGNAAFVIDRWGFVNANSTASKGTYGQVQAGPPPAGFPFTTALNFTTTTAYPAPVAGDAIRFKQSIEGANFLDAYWGTAFALPVVLEFWAYASAAGTYSASVINNAATRSYVSTFVLSATTWTKVRLNIPGDTSGAWAVAANAAFLQLSFVLCMGSTYQTATLNAWQAGLFLGATGAANVLSAVNNTLNITGVALMVGSAAQNAEPEFKKYADNLIDCCRYYQKLLVQPGGYSNTTGNGPTIPSIILPVQMRSTPTVTLGSPTTSNCTGLTINPMGPQSLSNFVTGVGAIGNTWWQGNLMCDADF
jgi:hypothetical protein